MKIKDFIQKEIKRKKELLIITPDQMPDLSEEEVNGYNIAINQEIEHYKDLIANQN